MWNYKHFRTGTVISESNYNRLPWSEKRNYTMVSEPTNDVVRNYYQEDKSDDLLTDLATGFILGSIVDNFGSNNSSTSSSDSSVDFGGGDFGGGGAGGDW